MNRNPPIMRLRLHCLWYDLATLLLPSLRRIYRCASSSRINVIYATRLSQPFPRNGERERERERGGCRRETNYFPRQHASMLFTAHNELFELSVERIQNVVPSPRSLQSPCRYFSQLYDETPLRISPSPMTLQVAYFSPLPVNNLSPRIIRENSWSIVGLYDAREKEICLGISQLCSLARRRQNLFKVNWFFFQRQSMLRTVVAFINGVKLNIFWNVETRVKEYF